MRRLWFAVLGIAVFFAGCASDPIPLDTEVARQFDIANNAIADLTTPGAEEVPRADLMQAVLQAQSAGTTLRVVVADTNGELISAKAVADRYGGTAISYQADATGFEGASQDLSSSQLDRAVDAAKLQSDMGQSAAAFVNVIETEGIEAPGRPLLRSLLLFVVLPIASLFLLWSSWSYRQARKRRVRRERDFADRKAVLHDWASNLGPEVDAVAAAAEGGDDAAKQTLAETKDFVATILPKLEEATSLGELDAAEMRIGRVAIKLRDLRKQLSV